MPNPPRKRKYAYKPIQQSQKDYDVATAWMEAAYGKPLHNRPGPEPIWQTCKERASFKSGHVSMILNCTLAKQVTENINFIHIGKPHLTSTGQEWDHDDMRSSINAEQNGRD